MSAPSQNMPPPVWNASIGHLIHLLDSVQRLAIRFIFNNFSRRSSVTKLGSSLPLDSLSSRRSITDLTMVFKIFNNEIHITPDQFFSPCPHQMTRGHHFKIYKPLCRLKSYRESFPVRIIDNWNNLDASLLSSPNSDVFRHRLHRNMVHPMLPSN